MLNFQCTIILHKSFRLCLTLSLVWFVIQITSVLISPHTVLTCNIIERPTHMTTTRRYFSVCFYCSRCCLCWRYLYNWTKEPPVVADIMSSPGAVNETKPDVQVSDHEVSLFELSLAANDRVVLLLYGFTLLSVCYLHHGHII